jgi:hypothetical protein
MFSLGNSEQCGGFTALTACPENMIVGIKPVTSAAKRIRFISPILWTWGTLVFFALLGWQIFRWLVKRNMAGQWSARAREFHMRRRQDRLGIQNALFREWMSGTGIFWTTTCLFVAAMGAQIALLYVEAKMDFFDGNDWTFGQIVAITIWVPPFFEYAWVLLSKYFIIGLLSGGAVLTDEQRVQKRQQSLTWPRTSRYQRTSNNPEILGNKCPSGGKMQIIQTSYCPWQIGRIEMAAVLLEVMAAMIAKVAKRSRILTCHLEQ